MQNLVPAFNEISSETKIVNATKKKFATKRTIRENMYEIRKHVLYCGCYSKINIEIVMETDFIR